MDYGADEVYLDEGGECARVGAGAGARRAGRGRPYWAAVGFGDIESANVVGYTAKEAQTDLNWYAPQFFSCGHNTTDINGITLDDGGAGTVGYGDTMQIVGPLGNASAIYYYWDKDIDLEKKAEGFYWGDAGCKAVVVSFDAGEGLAIDNASGLAFTINNAGDVPTSDVSFAAGADLNWSGNPFPEAISLNAVTLDDGNVGTVGYGDTLQIVGPQGNASAIYYYWDKDMDPEKKAEGFYWGDAGCKAVTVSLEPGDGFAIDNASQLAFDVKIARPYKK